jgi:DNA-binding cell septation regulator SpoVG
MHIGIEWHGDNFNVNLFTSPDKDAFLSVKGCRIVAGRNGDFVSWPAKKNEQTGKYWNHCYASDAFNAQVLEKAQASKPAQDTRTLAERKRPKDEVYRAGSPNDPRGYPPEDDPIPF